MFSHTIERYEQGGQELKDAIAGLSQTDLTAFPVPGTWSIQQIVIHLVDSDLIGADRMKRIIAEDRPELLGYDQNRFVAALFYQEQLIEDAVKIFDLNRRQFARVLHRLPAEAFERTGTHSERGVVTLGQQLHGYCDHLDHHLNFVQQKRQLLGKPLQ